MKNHITFFVTSLLSSGLAFTAPSALHCSTTTTTLTSPLHAYVPDGLSKEEYDQIKQKEQHALCGKNLGKLGPRGFKSRSLQAWQTARENGEVDHVFAPIG
ncbi:MAG: hypothetical protein ACP5E2_17145, partial [Terracidiphilus sp.]